MFKILFYLAMINTQHHIDLNREQTHCLAHAVHHEARGEPIMGQAAVAYVILNRVVSGRHPNDICSVVYEKRWNKEKHRWDYQFSGLERGAKIDYNGEEWEIAVEVAAYTQVGYLGDETDGATMYHNPITAPNPQWNFDVLELVGNLGRHRFYKET